ncbi:hypothetical protein [Parabacteroides sp. AM08-6]|uniref:hypothetical protein n=1 Tax=Parabacteroides sp. AM08-6 TaxID=2292053 RepID=UPI000F00E05E|nr:hypothetical protein DW103_10940 [Parabacteroides sp. AM08-6]
MNSTIKKISIVIITLTMASFSMIKGQDENKKLSFTVQGDLVSSYIWRGVYQTGVSFQPTLGLNIAGFSLTAWGSTDFDGNQASEGLANKEIDITAAIKFTDSFSLPIFAQAIWNPRLEDAHLVFGFTLRP